MNTVVHWLPGKDQSTGGHNQSEALGTEAFVQTLWDPDVTHIRSQPAPRNKSQDVFHGKWPNPLNPTSAAAIAGSAAVTFAS
jgi:hypothetical protein